MEYRIDIMRLQWDRRNGRFPPDDSDVEKDDVPILPHRMRRKSYYVRHPDEEGSPYAPPIFSHKKQTATPLHSIPIRTY